VFKGAPEGLDYGPVRTLVIDCSAMSFIDSSGVESIAEVLIAYLIAVVSSTILHVPTLTKVDRHNRYRTDFERTAAAQDSSVPGRAVSAGHLDDDSHALLRTIAVHVNLPVGTRSGAQVGLSVDASKGSTLNRSDVSIKFEPSKNVFFVGRRRFAHRFIMITIENIFKKFLKFSSDSNICIRFLTFELFAKVIRMLPQRSMTIVFICKYPFTHSNHFHLNFFPSLYK
jgi:hypothetical protein